MKLRKITTLVIALALVSVVAACGTTEISPDSPSGVSVRFVEAARSKDVKTFKSLLSKKSLQTMDKDSKEAGMATDAMIATMLEQDLFPKGAGSVETRNEKITGERATVEIKGESDKWSENELVKEDGGWKVTLE